ncbi:MAG TPA: hypothetical protein VL357_09455 [Rariglobus sp.]|jgi:hypothetical protein|nr:hypothetical protein [Rariglobus sp.]
MPSASSHVWKFFRIGGLDQVAIETGADLLALKHLDQKLWVALSCPVKGLELDEKTLALIDADKDGRIRVPEILAAIDWATIHLKDVGDLLKDRDYLPLSAINDQTPDGRGTLASARTILRGIGKADAEAVTLAEAADTVKLFAATTFNGDGVITPETATDDETRQVINDIIATVGGLPDRSGKTGIDQAKADAFYAAATACIDWLIKGSAPEILTLGEGTSAAYAAIKAVRVKVDDFFARTRLATYDTRSLASLNRSEGDYIALAAHDLSATAQEIAGFPLSHIEAGKALPLLTAVNPAWAAAIATLHRDAVSPVFGDTTLTLTEAGWNTLKDKVAPYEGWLASKAGDVVEPLGPDRIKAILTGNTRDTVNSLLAQDKALEPEFNAVHGVERLIRYTRDFRVLLQNFVNFFDFYSPERPAVFQAGTLFLDSRSTELCIQVAGPSPLAAMSKAYIAYCDCKRIGGASMKIAACFTQGDSDYLFTGRNGIFYDRQGRDWDATITSIADNPISIRQAFFSPYKKFVRLIEEQVAKRAAAAEAESSTKLAATAETTVNADKKKPEAKKIDIGTVAAMGVAVGAIGGALGAIATGLAKLAFWQLPLVFIALIAAISGPSMIIAAIKLHQRTLGPILDANGWAINGRVKINIPFGTRLTERAVRPVGSKLNLTDPYEDKEASRRRKQVVALVIFLALAAAAGWIRHNHNVNGHYFWQPKPEPVVAPTAEPPAAPTNPAPVV